MGEGPMLGFRCPYCHSSFVCATNERKTVWDCQTCGNAGSNAEWLADRRAEADAEVERLRALLHEAHVDLGADAGVTETDCSCPECVAHRAALRGEEESDAE